MLNLQADEDGFTAILYAMVQKQGMAKTKVHIGNMIRRKLKEQGRSVTWFASAIHSDRSNTYKMLKRESIDLVLLMHISELLHYDFLYECSQLLDFGPENGRAKSEN